MNFNFLKDKYEYYRSITDVRLIPNSYVMVMLDGRSFSRFTKKYFLRPFDISFINMMNKTAKYICENVENAKFAYVQSDEINIVLSDFDNEKTEAFFSYRLSKILSICASMASAKFNNLLGQFLLDNESIYSLKDQPLIEFDCKAWNLPSFDEVYSSILYRQRDCVRNSIQQTAQTYFSHHKLNGLNVDEQKELLIKIYDVDWDKFDDGKRFGRFIIKKDVVLVNDNGEPFNRKKWEVINGCDLSNKDGDINGYSKLLDLCDFKKAIFSFDMK